MQYLINKTNLTTMRKIEAIIRKSKFKHVKSALIDRKITRFNYYLVRSSADSEERYYKGEGFIKKAEMRVKLTVYADKNQVQNILDIILKSGKTGDAKEAFISIYKSEIMYCVKGDNGEDRLVEVI
jgi:nitrogen regulatory protein P-II 1